MESKFFERFEKFRFWGVIFFQLWVKFLGAKFEKWPVVSRLFWIGQLPNAANASQFNEYEWDGKGSMSIEFVIQKREPSLET